MGQRNLSDECAGFTLLELLVVLAILASAAIFTIPRLGGTQTRLSLQNATYKLVADLRTAQSDAVRNNSEKTLTIDVNRHSYWSDSQQSSQKIPDAINLTLSGKNIEWISDTAGRIRFQPEGSGTEATIILKEERRQASISIDWLTGGVHLGWQP